MPLRFNRTPRLVKLFLSLVLTLPLVLPVNFVLINPGEGSPLFPKLLNITSTSASPVTTYPVDGQMYLLSIWVTNPESEILGYRVLRCWAENDCVVVPRSVVYQPETDDKTEIAMGKKEMAKSQSTALLATKKLLAQYHPEINLNQMTDASIKISLKNTGGPSGGLIFALGLAELLTPEDILQGRKIAATGTISAQGKVGPIGGVEEKITAARKSGTELIFISRENCDEVPEKVAGLGVIAVSTLEEAYKSLINSQDSNFQGVKGCTNLDS
jgi:PDZ domain-containing protein